MLGFPALVGGQLGADRHIARDMPVFPDWRGTGEYPIEITVFAAVLHRAGPRLAHLERGPEILERFGRHIRVTNYVVRLADQLCFRETGCGHELVVEIRQSSLGV